LCANVNALQKNEHSDEEEMWNILLTDLTENKFVSCKPILVA